MTEDALQPSSDLAAVIAAGHVPAGGVTLDLGCGAGTDAIFLAHLGFRSIGIDESAEAIAAARARISTADTLVDWRTGSLLELPFADNSIHFATDHAGFDGLEAREWEQYAGELARVLIPGARFLLSSRRLEDAETLDRVFAPEFGHGAIVPHVAQSPAGPERAHVIVLERR